MYALRHSLLRCGAARRIGWILLLLVLLSRALIPGAVMLDPDASGPDMMVLCSGHGPMRMSGDDMAGMNAMSGMSMSDMPTATGADASRLDHLFAHAPDSGQPAQPDDDSGVCAFSAALFAAMAVAFVVVLLAPAGISRRLRVRFPRLCLPATPTGQRPPARAPPAFV
jgi:hypothetical protein